MGNSNILDFSVNVDITGMENNFVNLINDKATMLEVHNKFAQMCDPYVPMLNGPLHESAFAQVSEKSVKYGGTAAVPYARRQYYGVDFNHTIEKHPKATAMWDQAMMREQGEVFEAEVQAILVRRYKELYG